MISFCGHILKIGSLFEIISDDYSYRRTLVVEIESCGAAWISWNDNGVLEPIRGLTNGTRCFTIMNPIRLSPHALASDFPFGLVHLRYAPWWNEGGEEQVQLKRSVVSVL